jgi:2-polyprenyl-3-methyl-5-hydroxy-6-metoxy-1,4-benzoquinol methylase
LAPTNRMADSLEAQADALARSGRRQEAIRLCARAIEAGDPQPSLKARFIKLAGSASVAEFESWIEAAILGCLRSSSVVDCQRMHRLWLTHITSHPEFRLAFGLHKLVHFDPANKAFFEGLTHFGPLMTERFLEGIKHIVPPVPVFEEFLTHVRRHLLLHPQFFEDRIKLAIALAQYAFNTGYLLDTTEEESSLVWQLGTGDEDLAVFACYHPLDERGMPADALMDRTALHELVRIQVEAPYKLRLTTVPSMTGIDEQSAQVRATYESYPYPVWTTLSGEEEARRWRLSKRNQEIEGHLADRKVKILVAGCGTGEEAISYACIFPKAEVLAIDLSRNSLAFGLLKAQEFGINNIRFRQADILRLDGLTERFDYIISSGVLHHMPDPLQGWKALVGLLSQGGLMKIGLYSRLAHRHIMKAQAVAKAHGYSDPHRFRRASPSLLDRVTLHNLCAKGDYYHLNMYRDLLFHVQEHRFSIPEIAERLDWLSLEFKGFHLPASVAEAYREKYPSDTCQTDLKNWDAFEIEHPDTFRNMYLLWCRADQ